MRLNRRHPLSRGLVGAWLFTEGNSSRFHDSSGRGLDSVAFGTGSTFNGVVRDGHGGWAYPFNGVTGFNGGNSIVMADSQEVIKGSNAITFSTWLYLFDQTEDTRAAVIIFEPAEAGMYIEATGKSVQFGGNVGGFDFFAQSSFTLSNSIWYHVAVTFQTGVGTKFYLNGEFQNLDTLFTTMPLDVNSLLTPVLGGNSHGVLSLYGNMESLLWHNYALADSQVRRLYNDTYGMFVPDRSAEIAAMSVVSSSNTTYFPSGGIVAAGSSLVKTVLQTNVQPAGVLGGGVADVTVESASVSARAAGAASFNVVRRAVSDGQLGLVGGSALTQAIYTATPAPAGVVGSGAALLGNIVAQPVVSGGVRVDGAGALGYVTTPTFLQDTVAVVPSAHSGKAGTRFGSTPLAESNGLAHRWGLSEARTTQIYDSARGSTGALVTANVAANWVSDATRRGYALELANDADYVSVPGVVGLNGASQLTFSGWVQPYDLTTSRPFLSKQDVGLQNGFAISWEPGQGFTASFLNGTFDRAYTGAGGFTTGRWYHLTVVYNGGQVGNSQRLRIYVDGLAQPLSFVGTIPPAVVPAAAAFLIGRRSSAYWKGRLDDIRIYNRALAASEVARLSRVPSLWSWRNQPAVLAVTKVSTLYGLRAAGATPVNTTFGPPAVSPNAVLASSARVVATYSLVTSGGVLGGGAVVVVSSYIPTGGSLGGGTAAPAVGFVSFGGVLGGSTAAVTAVWSEPEGGQAAKGVRAAGSVLLADARLLEYEGAGEIVVAGAARAGVPSRHYNASGGLVLDSADTGSPRFRFDKLFGFPWRVNAQIEKEIVLNWNVGQLKAFWYRIVSKPVAPGECPVQGLGCCQQFTITMHARTLAELCQKLSKRQFKFPIQTVEQFSRPAETAQVASDAASGIDDSCQTLTPVNVCHIPECADFCVDFDLHQTVGFSITAQVNAFRSYAAEGEAFLTGAADTSFVRFLPDFPYVMQGSFTVDGVADHSPNSFTSRGGAYLGGAAAVQSNDWKFVGGVWPSDSGQRFATLAFGQPDTFTDQPWQLAERALDNDNLFTQSDISYGKHSEYLALTHVGFGLPAGAEVLGIQVSVVRVATQSGVRDEGLYLVRGGRPISDNLADPTVDWPLIETARTYGNNATGGRPWRDPDGDHYPGPFTADDLNDPTFGFALRVVARSPLPIQIAKVNYVTVRVYYDDAAGSRVRVGGESRCRSAVYHYPASGKVSLDSSGRVRAGYRYRCNGVGPSGDSQIDTGGHGSTTFYEATSGGTAAGGSGKVTPFLEVMSGGTAAGGSGKVTPFLQVMSGGTTAGGQSLRNDRIFYAATGGFSLSSFSFVPEKKLFYTASGGFAAGGTVGVRASRWRFAAGGGATAAGSAGQRAGSLGTFTQEFTLDISVVNTTASFLSDVDKGDAQPLSGTVNKCGCLDIPLTVDLTQNIIRSNQLSKFLIRNNYNTPKVIKLRYNGPNDSWQCNLHYRGQSAEASAPESWDLVFELKCTDVMGGISIGRNVWKLASEITRRNLVTRQAQATRIVMAVLPEPICDVQGAVMNFTVDFDTQAGVSTVSPNTTVYQDSVYDNIGLFRNPAWIADPVLTLVVSQAGREPSTQRVDITGAVLVN